MQPPATRVSGSFKLLFRRIEASAEEPLQSNLAATDQLRLKEPAPSSEMFKSNPSSRSKYMLSLIFRACLERLACTQEVNTGRLSDDALCSGYIFVSPNGSVSCEIYSND